VRSSIDLPTQEQSRASFDRGRRSGSTSRLSLRKSKRREKSPLRKKQGSTDSFVQSLDKETESSMAVHSTTTGTQESASQMLNRSDVFQSPTINRLRASPTASKEDLRRKSEDTTRSTAAQADSSAQPPSHAQSGAGVAIPRHTSMQISPGHSDIDSDGVVKRNDSAANLQDLLKAGSYPLQRAAGFAGYLKSRSSRMSKLLATESMGYIEKVSGMWAEVESTMERMRVSCRKID